MRITSHPIARSWKGGGKDDKNKISRKKVEIGEGVLRGLLRVSGRHEFKIFSSLFFLDGLRVDDSVIFLT